MRRSKKFVIASVIAGVLLFGSLGGVALANDGDATDHLESTGCYAPKCQRIAASISAAVEAGELTAEEGLAKLTSFRKDHHAKDSDLGKLKPHVEMVKTVADLIGIDVKTLWGELKAGRSVAEVAMDNAVDPQTIVDALVAQVQARLAKAIAAGRISAEEAADGLVRAKLEERLINLVYRTSKK